MMAKKQLSAEDTPAVGPVDLTYVGPPDEDSPRYGSLVPGRVYQETDPAFADYLVATHPDHWTRA